MTMSRSAVFAALKSRGADRAVVAFSGGGDEGGPDSITLYTGEQELSTLPTWPGTSKDAVDTDIELADALSDPISKEYGSFAGDFDVTGEVIWQTEGETVKLTKDERANYEHSEDYV
jgi:hypothetical protein